VILGEVTLLFQFVVPPPIQPKPQLPASVRQGWIRGMDWVFASIFLVSFLLHSGFVIYLSAADFPTQVAWDDIPDTFAEALAEPPKPIEKKVEKKDDKGEEKKAEEAPKEEAKEAPKAAAAPKKKKEISAEEAARLAAQRRARLADQVARLGALSIIGAKKDGSGGVADLLKGGGTGDVEAAFDKIGGVGIAGPGAGGALGGKGASGSGRLQSIGQLGTRGAGSVGSVGDKGPEKKVRAIVRASAPSIDGKIDASIVAKEIRRRMKSIQACYERELKRNPKLGGKIGLRITIGTVGKVTNAAIESDSVGDPTINACVKTTVLRWRFPAPDGGSAEVVIPIVLQSSN
jgi:TonB family protein